MKYLVTDPCYLLDLDRENSDRIWHKCLNDMYSLDSSARYSSQSDYEGTQKILSEELGINVLKVSDTGFGDWSNTLTSNSKHINIIKEDFYADAGMMCVVEINEKLENFLKDHDIGAIFEADCNISVDVDDNDSQWYVLKITDENGWNVLASSEQSNPEFDEDEDNDYDDFYEDEENEYTDFYDQA